MIYTSSEHIKTSFTRSPMELSRELNSEIRQEVFVNCLVTQTSCSMRENLPSRRERSLWAYHLQEVKVLLVDSRLVELVQVGLQQRLPQVINMEALAARILRNLDTITLISLVEDHTIHTQRHKVRQLRQLRLTRSHKTARHLMQTPTMTQIAISHLLIATILKPKGKRRRNKRRRQRRRPPRKLRRQRKMKK